MDPQEQVWSREQVRHLLGLTERQLRSWERQKLVAAAGEYSFRDLIALRTLVSLRRKRVPAVRIRRALTAIREKLGDSLTELKVYTDGKRIAVQVSGQKLEPVTGQLLLDFDAAELNRLLAFPSRERDRRAEGDRWFHRALAMEQSGHPVPEVIEAYQKAVEFNPDCAGAYVNLGTIHYHTRNWTEAEKYYGKAIEADAHYPLAQFNLGNLYDELGDRAKALFHYNAALQLDPNYADAHYNVALLLQSTGQLMRAVRHWQIYLKLEPAGSWAEIARRQLEHLTHTTVLPGHRKNA